MTTFQLFFQSGQAKDLSASLYVTNVTMDLGANMKYVHNFDVDFFYITFGMSVVL